MVKNPKSIMAKKIKKNKYLSRPERINRADESSFFNGSISWIKTLEAYDAVHNVSNAGS